MPVAKLREGWVMWSCEVLCIDRIGRSRQISEELIGVGTRFLILRLGVKVNGGAGGKCC